MTAINDYLILISGTSASGKSASLKNLKDPEGVIYLNCEAGKKLPFTNKFQRFVITDPHQVLEAFDALAAGKITGHTVIVDSLTFLLDMYETKYIVGSSNGQQAWQNFQQFFKTLMQDKVASSTCNVIFTAHTLTTLNENEMAMETKVPVKGALKNNGIEAYFSCVVSTKKVSVTKLEASDYDKNILDITEDDQDVGFKYVFQTRLTKDTAHERIRSPMGMFQKNQTFMDNDVQKLLDHLHSYYEE